MLRKTNIGRDRFVSTLAPTAVEGLRVLGSSGELVATSRSAIPVEGAGRLLVAAWAGAVVSSESPEPDFTVEYLGADGKTLGRAKVGD